MSLINQFRIMIQTELNKINGLDAGKIVSDDAIVQGQ